MEPGGHHHLSARKRRRNNFPTHTHDSALIRFLDRAMPVIALGGPLALIPQVLQVLITKDVSSLSLPTWLWWELSGFIWLAYGLAHRDIPIIVANGAYLVLQGIILVAIFMYW